MSNSGKDWTRDETVIAFYKLVSNNYSKKKEYINYLATKFNRTYGSVDWKISNLLNPNTNGSKLDKDIISQYSKNGELLKKDAEIALDKMDTLSKKLLEKIFQPTIKKNELTNLNDFPEESESLSEGNRKQIIVNRYERNTEIRKKAIEFHGLNCKVCDFNFLKSYGEIGKQFIEVHHLTPLSEQGGINTIRIESDLTVLCSNCHSMIHRRSDKLLTIDELKKTLKKA